MAIIVEDGTGLSTANAFIIIADADIYFSIAGNSTWGSAEDEPKQQAIIKATRYMEKRFSNRWRGLVMSSTQALSWPRNYVYDELGKELSDQVPVEIANACAEYAVYALNHELIPPIIYPVADGAPVPFGRVSRKIEKVGPIYEETYYATGGSNITRVSSGSSQVDSDRLVQYPEADLLVSSFLKGSRGVTR